MWRGSLGTPKTPLLEVDIDERDADLVELFKADGGVDSIDSVSFQRYCQEIRSVSLLVLVCAWVCAF